MNKVRIYFLSILLISFLGFSPPEAVSQQQQARMSLGVMGGTVPAETPPAGCTDSYDSVVPGVVNDYATQGSYTGNYQVGKLLYNPTTQCVCKATVWISLSAGSVSAKTYYASFWTLSSNNLDTLQGQESVGVTGSDSWSDTAVDFSFSPCVNLTNGTNYGLSIRNGAIDASNYIKLARPASGGYTGIWAADKSLTTYDSVSIYYKTWY